MDQSFLAGSVGGLCTVLVGHPFDTIKVRLQSDTFRTLGFRGMYSGIMSPISGVVPIFAISFGTYNTTKTMLGLDKVSAAACSAICTSPIVTPLEMIKLRAQTNNVSFQNAVKSISIKNMYRGYGATLCRDVPGCILFFSSYDNIKSSLPSSSFYTMISGGLAGIAVWTLNLPTDTVKTRYQTSADKTWLHSVQHIWKTRGVKGFYRGFLPAMFRAFPANAACFLGYEYVMSF